MIWLIVGLLLLATPFLMIVDYARREKARKE